MVAWLKFRSVGIFTFSMANTGKGHGSKKGSLWMCGGKHGCRYNANKIGWSSCKQCGRADTSKVLLQVPAVAPYAGPKGKWAHGSPSNWANETKPATELEPEQLVAMLRKNEVFGGESAKAIEILPARAETSRAEAKAAKPLSVQIRHLENRVADKARKKATA